MYANLELERYMEAARDIYVVLVNSKYIQQDLTGSNLSSHH
jgi:hypothetical protein